MEGIPHVSNEELVRTRDSLPNYKFRIFDSSFSRSYGRDAELLLSYGRELLYESAEISEDRLLLAKAEGGGRTAALYVDRDYFEISLWDEDGHHHAGGWQWPIEFRGHTVDDLELVMARHLLPER